MSESWTLTKTFRFEASHQLKHHDGKCSRLHGHSWCGAIEVSGGKLMVDGPKTNMLMDYADLSKIVKQLVDEFLDHYHLNETLYTDSPTSEFIARWIYMRVKPMVAAGLLLAVTIEETCTSRCRYTVLWQ